MLKFLMLFLVLASLCATGGAQEKKSPPPEDKDYTESGSCTDRVSQTFDLLSKLMIKSEPVAMEKADPCKACNVSRLSTIGLSEDKLVKICPDKNDPEGMYYFMSMCFQEIRIDCAGCKMMHNGKEHVGSYSGTWKKPEVDVRCMKEVWNGDDLKVMESKVTTEFKSDLVEGDCKDPETDGWVDCCKEAEKTGGFSSLFLGACQTTFSASANDNLQKDKKEKGDNSDALAKTMTCNKDDKEES